MLPAEFPHMAEFPPFQLLPYQAVSLVRAVRVLMEGFEPKARIHTELNLTKGERHDHGQLC